MRWVEFVLEQERENSPMTIEELVNNVKALIENPDLPDDFVVELTDLLDEALPEPLAYSEFRFEVVLDISDTRYNLNVPDAAERIQRIKSLMENDPYLKDELNSVVDHHAENFFDDRANPDNPLPD
jgi:hypothetical protein